MKRFSAAARWLLLLRIVPTRAGLIRVVDMIILPVGVVVASVICFPILVSTIVGAYVVAFLLGAIGAPAALQIAVGLGLGLGGGIVLCFFVLLRLSRRLPTSIRAIVYEADETVAAPTPVTENERRAEALSLFERVAAADATLTPGATDPGDDTTDSSA